jgi:hypothetical protein
MRNRNEEIEILKGFVLRLDNMATNCHIVSVLAFCR